MNDANDALVGLFLTHEDLEPAFEDALMYLDRCEAEGYRQRQAERAARRAGRVVVVGMAVTLVGMMSMVRVTGVAVAFAVVMGVPVVWRTGCGMRSHARL